MRRLFVLLSVVFCVISLFIVPNKAFAELGDPLCGANWGGGQSVRHHCLMSVKNEDTGVVRSFYCEAPLNRPDLLITNELIWDESAPAYCDLTSPDGWSWYFEMGWGNDELVVRNTLDVPPNIFMGPGLCACTCPDADLDDAGAGVADGFEPVDFDYQGHDLAIFGDDGNDKVWGGYQQVTRFWGGGATIGGIIWGSPLDGGADTFMAGTGSDYFSGGSGNDVMFNYSDPALPGCGFELVYLHGGDDRYYNSDTTCAGLPCDAGAHVAGDRAHPRNGCINEEFDEVPGIAVSCPAWLPIPG